MKESINVASRVLAIEAQGISALAGKLDENFEKAVEMLLNLEGRIIVTGMGKAGIIGRKIAATFSSIGCPAYFVHPEEALHGDLGMIADKDVVLGISNSGETAEILHIVTLIQTIKKIGASIIAFTGNVKSTLAEHSDLVIDVSVEKEACPMNLIPTASTAAALAMGDALAMAVLEKKGFSPEDYAFYHPGGELGKRLLKIKHIMRKKNMSPVVADNTPIIDALHKISRAHAGIVAVVDSDGRLKGVFTDGDLRRSIEKDEKAPGKPISLFMTSDPTYVTADMLVAEALRIVKQKDIGALVVVDDHMKPIGIVDERDLLGLV